MSSRTNTPGFAAWIIGACTMLILAQLWSYARRVRAPKPLGSQELLVE